MKKTTLRQAALKLALLAVALLAPTGLWAQETVQIGDDASTSTQYYYPVNMYYHYSMSEQIYDADEIGMEGTITSISFYYTYNSAFSMENVTLYMKNTDKTVFESSADMEALSAADIVWNGTLEASASGWITIELTTPFVYDGSSNLMVAAYYPNYTYPGSSFKFRTTSCTGYKAITWYSDNYIPDPYNPDPSTWTGSGHTKSYHQYRTNIQLVIEPPAAGDCERPETVTVSDITPTSAQLNWEGGSTPSNGYNVELKGGEYTDWTPIYSNISQDCILTNLTANTAYQARVQVVCSSSVSSWKTASFTTPNPCAVPTDLIVSNITGTSATLSWTEGYQETSWTVKYKKSSQSWEDATEETATGTPSITLNNLDDFTSYDVRVFNCENYVSGNFTTLMECPDGVVCIGSGTATNNYYPANNYYKYSLTEQIYTADEIGDAGAILSISFYKNNTTSMVKNLDIYMMSTSVDAFTGTSDWIVPTAANLVYSGTVTFADNAWTTIDLDVPFIYDGTSNVVILFDNKTGSYSGNTSTPFLAFSASENNQGIYFYQDGSSLLDPTNPSANNSGVTTQKNIIRMVIGEPPSCLRPTGVTASNVTAHEATITWTSDADSWQIQLGEETPIDVTDVTSHTFTGLDPEETYSVIVRSLCGGTYSEWTNAVSFTTGIACPVPTSVTVSDVDGHNATVTWTEAGSATHWDVTYKLSTDDDAVFEENVTTVSTASHTLSGLDPETTYYVKVRAACGGEDGNSQWVTRNFTTTVACPAPTALNATLTPGDGSVATLSWTSNASDFVLEYGTESDFTGATSVNVSGTSENLTGLTAETQYYARVKALCGGEDGQSAWSATCTFTPTDAYSITLNDGTATNNYVPIHGGYCDYGNRSQFIIPATDLASLQWGSLTQLTFWSNNTVSSSYFSGTVFDIYMKEVENTEFASTEFVDWESMENVYSGSLVWSGTEWVFQLDNPYVYTGGNLLIGFHQTSYTSSYTSTYWLGVNQSTNTALSQYANSSHSWTGSVNTRQFLPKVKINFIPGVAPACDAPTNLENTEPTAHNVTLSWDAEAGDQFQYQLIQANLSGTEILALAWDAAISTTDNSLVRNDLQGDADYTFVLRRYCNTTEQSNPAFVHFHTLVSCPVPTDFQVSAFGADVTVQWNGTTETYNVEVNGTVTEGVTSPYIFTGNLATTYEIKVQAVCGGEDGNSAWTTPQTVTTDLCLAADMCEITITMIDAYGDGGGNIQVVDVATSNVLASYTMPDHNEQNVQVTDSYTLAVCNGRELNFVFTNTDNWPYENGWIITDVNGEVIAERTENLGQSSNVPTNGVIATYTVNCAPPTCPRPTNLTAGTPGPYSVELTWDENGTAEQWQICVNGDEENLITADENPYTLTLPTAETEYTVKVRAYCDVTDQSNWSNEVTFTTSVACPAPSDIAASVSGNTATITWTGYNDSYNLRYRKPAFFYDFEMATPWIVDAFAPCSTYDGDGISVWGINGVSHPNQQYTGACIAFQNGMDGGNLSSYSGDAFGMMICPVDGSPANDWLILPEITIENGYVLSFMGREITTQYGDEIINIGVYGTTDGTFAETIAEDVAVNSTTWAEFSYDLSAYAGQTIRLAINYVSADIFGFMIDDIFVGDPTVWDATVEDITSTSYDIPNVVSDAGYQVQVQGECTAESESTAWVSGAFNTLTPAFTKEILANKWYAISSPRVNRGEDIMTFTGIENLVSPTTNETDPAFFKYDLYRYDEATGMWENSVEADYNTLEQGRGYIYRRSTDGILSFSGITTSADVNVTASVANSYDMDLLGFNLVGNPFNQQINFGTCYSLEPNGTWLAQEDYSPAVAEGIMVRWFDPITPISFSTVAKKSAPAALEGLTFTVSNNEFRDVVYAMFNGAQKLTKIGHLNSNAPALSIPVDGIRYAIANLGSNCESFDMNFSGNDGEYTITLNSKLSNMSYLHLIDRATGNDIDLLRTPTYTFTHSSIEAIADRFLVKMSASIFDNQEGQIARFNGNGWTVQGDGNLQVFDVLGRNVMNVEVNAQSSINNSQFPGTGVYILRLGEKSQKIVVK